ncbi:hypothetical protein [Desulfocurvus vexinensis]|uniref:hypothetical protein n=1 Tax=Desulfocurvus vexinensis TaxID=399548 RepID=UPI0004B61B62|nr:hypothetical protein [Desulfocurvus vexinensis]
MHKQIEYEVLRPGFISGAWRQKGDTARLTEREARYFLLAGLLGHKAQGEVAKPKGKK